MYATNPPQNAARRTRSRTKAVSARLEQVRERVQCRTLRDFWREITQDGSYRVSYEAIRNYHSDRDPPVEYLVRVSEVFGADLRWLATGAGAPFPPDPSVGKIAESVNGDGRLSEFESAIGEVFWHYSKLPPLAAAVILKTCERLYRDAHYRAQLEGKSGPSRGYVGRFVGKALAGPLVNAVAGTVRTADLHVWQIESYVVGICQALVSLIPNPHFTEVRFEERLH